MMENRTVWTVRYTDSTGAVRKAEYFCLTENQARKMFIADNGNREIISVMDWREDMRRYGK